MNIDLHVHRFDWAGSPADIAPCVEDLAQRAERELADSEEHVDLRGPGPGLPAGESVVDRPLVQARVAVRQRVRACQHRDYPDRVQRGVVQVAAGLIGVPLGDLTLLIHRDLPDLDP